MTRDDTPWAAYAYWAASLGLQLAVVAVLVALGDCSQPAICVVTDDGGCAPGPCDKQTRLETMVYFATLANLVVATVVAGVATVRRVRRDPEAEDIPVENR